MGIWRPECERLPVSLGESAEDAVVGFEGPDQGAHSLVGVRGLEELECSRFGGVASSASRTGMPI
jgi:hypothetical protein